MVVAVSGGALAGRQKSTANVNGNGRAVQADPGMTPL